MSAYGILDPRLLDADALSVADPVEDGALLMIAGLYFFVALAERAVFFICVFLVCRFSYRAMKNLYTARSVIPHMSPGAAVYWYFVPFACWALPANAMSQIFKGSFAEAGKSDRSNLIKFWWTAWVLSVIALSIGNMKLLPLIGIYWSLAAGMFFALPAALCLRQLVTQIADAQKFMLQNGAAQVFE